MRSFKKKARVSNSRDPEQSFEERFWVDTGALYSFVPEDRLEAIGVEPSATRRLVLAGSIPCPVVFTPKGSLYLLGATAFEDFGVEVDPVNKRLKPILAVIGGFLASA